MDINAAAPELDITPTIDELPLDAFAGFVGSGSGGLPSLFALATCSKSWQLRIYRGADCRHLWKSIDLSRIGPDRDKKLFGTVPSESRHGVVTPLVQKEKIVDRNLANLLRKVDARNITERLILRGCKSITGTGLGPLSGSTCLTELDIFFSYDKFDCGMISRTDIDAVGQVIRTMPPLTNAGTHCSAPNGLKIISAQLTRPIMNVQVSPPMAHEEREELVRKTWQLMDEFSAALAKRMISERTECNCCGDLLYEKVVSSMEVSETVEELDLSEEVLETVGEPNLSDCNMCQHVAKWKRRWDELHIPEEYYPIIPNHHTEKGFSLTAQGLVCYECKNTSCGQGKCPAIHKCVDCSLQKCTSCGELTVCETCGMSYCHACGDFIACDACHRMSKCKECNEQDEPLVNKCEAEGCSKMMCADCGGVNYCEWCKGYKCEQCASPNNCDDCGLFLCSEHLIKCDGCPNYICQDCCFRLRSMEVCCHCDRKYCGPCAHSGPDISTHTHLRGACCRRVCCEQCRSSIRCRSCDRAICDNGGCLAMHSGRCR